MLPLVVVFMFFVSLVQFCFAEPPTDYVQLRPQRQTAPLTPAPPVAVGRPITPHPITIQRLYRVTCTATVCSCEKPNDIVISGGGKCRPGLSIVESYPLNENTWRVICNYVSWRGGSLEMIQRSQDLVPADLRPLWIGSTLPPMQINILCAETGS